MEPDEDEDEEDEDDDDEDEETFQNDEVDQLDDETGDDANSDDEEDEETGFYHRSRGGNNVLDDDESDEGERTTTSSAAGADGPPIKRRQCNGRIKDDWRDSGEDTNEKYCICKDVSYGDMIMCDNTRVLIYGLLWENIELYIIIIKNFSFNFKTECLKINNAHIEF